MLLGEDEPCPGVAPSMVSDAAPNPLVSVTSKIVVALWCTKRLKGPGSVVGLLEGCPRDPVVPSQVRLDPPNLHNGVSFLHLRYDLIPTGARPEEE